MIYLNKSIQHNFYNQKNRISLSELNKVNKNLIVVEIDEKTLTPENSI
jgi:hypothetical protein